MSVTQALGKGYGVTNGLTRLVMRGSPHAPETYQQDVSEPDSDLTFKDIPSQSLVCRFT